MKKPVALFLAAALPLALAACAAPVQGSSSTGAASPVAASFLPSAGSMSVSGEAAAHTPPCLFTRLVEEAFTHIELPKNGNAPESIQAVFNYVLAANAYIPLDEPELTESWRYLDHCGSPPTVYQVMATSPLLYGLASCEHYAALLMVLLEHLGFETRYVAGLTFSVQGHLVDHAWVMVQIDDEWYHIDPQLEDNVTRSDTVNYHYFLKDDATFRAHHVWGAQLPVPDENALALPVCSGLAPTPAPVGITQAAPTPQAALRQARQHKLAANGYRCSLAPLGTLPPLPRNVQAATTLPSGED